MGLLPRTASGPSAHQTAPLKKAGDEFAKQIRVLAGQPVTASGDDLQLGVAEKGLAGNPVPGRDQPVATTMNLQYRGSNLTELILKTGLESARRGFVREERAPAGREEFAGGQGFPNSGHQLGRGLPVQNGSQRDPYPPIGAGGDPAQENMTCRDSPSHPGDRTPRQCAEEAQAIDQNQGSDQAWLGQSATHRDKPSQRQAHQGNRMSDLFLDELADTLDEKAGRTRLGEREGSTESGQVQADDSLAPGQPVCAGAPAECRMINAPSVEQQQRAR